MKTEYKRNFAEVTERKCWLRRALEILKMPGGTGESEKNPPVWKKSVGKTNHVPFYRTDSKETWIK